jgi:hypothetical protein
MKFRTAKFLLLGAILSSPICFVLWHGSRIETRPARQIHNQEPRTQPIREKSAVDIGAGTSAGGATIDKAPLSFEQRWAAATSNGRIDVPTRNEIYLKIVLDILETQGHSAAIEFLTNHSGPGVNQNFLITNVFRHSPLGLKELIASQDGLETKQQKYAAYDGLLFQASESAKFRIADFDGIHTFDQRLRNILLLTAKAELADAKSGGQHLQSKVSNLIATIQHVGDATQSKDLLNHAIHEMADIAPFELWHSLLSAGVSFDQSAANSLVSAMMGQSPEKAIQDLVTTNGLDPNLYATAIRRWLDDDTDAANQWFADNRSKLAPIAEQQIVTQFAALEARNGDFASSWKWIGEIVDPAIRTEAEGKVWNSERDAVRRAVGQDPGGMLDALASGSSQHRDYWIEEALVTWISKEPEKAEEWYQANWNSLPPAKSQYVAAAYAKNALGLGDTATARQWTHLIQDPKTRERIEASIAKAEAGGAP